MKKWKLITLICSAVLLVGVAILLVFIFTDKEEQEYKYPTIQPTISNPGRVYLELGSKKVTYQELYDFGLVSYGLTTLIDLVDELVINLEVTQNEINEHKKSLYAAYNEIELEEVDLEDVQQTEKFIEQMNYQGYMTNEDIEAAIKLDLVRNKKAKAMLEEDIKNFEPIKDKDGKITQQYYFTDAQVENAIKNASPDKAEIIYLTFRSEAEALSLMTEFDIDKNNLASGWVHLSNGKTFTKEEILATFVNMYNKLNSTKIVENKYPVLTEVELSEVSSSLASQVFDFADLSSSSNVKECMTVTPKKYSNGYYYLAVKNSTTVTITKDQFIDAFKNNQLTGNAKLVYDKLVDSFFTSSIINTYLYKNRFDLGIKIYDEGLDIKYTNSSSNALSGYVDVYQGTLEENGTYLVTINVDGTQKQITADQLLEEMLKRYGALIATEFINRYMMFNQSYSSIYDYEAGNKLGLYDVIYKSEIETYKTALEDGTLANYGYYPNYGWENFVTDYFGVQNEAELVMIGNAYTMAFENYSIKTYTLTNELVNEIYEKFHLAYEVPRVHPGSITPSEFNEYLETLKEEDYINTFLYQIIDRLNKYFDVKAGSLKFYVDKNNDTKFDDLEEADIKLGTTLIEALFLIADDKLTEINEPKNEVEVLAQNILVDLKNQEFWPVTTISGSTLGERLARLVMVYNNSSVSNKTFAVYKEAGIRLQIDQESSYTDSSATEDLGVLLKDAWNQILNGTLVLKNGDIASFAYTDLTNTAVNAKSAENLSTSNTYRIEEVYEDETSVSIVFLTGATNSTWYNYHEIIVSMVPTKTVSDLQVLDLDRLQGFVDYYVLSNRSEENLTNEESSKLNGLDAPSAFQKNYISNVLKECFEYFTSDARMADFMYDYRKSGIAEGIIKFRDPQNEANYLKMLEIIFKEE